MAQDDCLVFGSDVGNNDDRALRGITRMGAGEMGRNRAHGRQSAPVVAIGILLNTGQRCFLRSMDFHYRLDCDRLASTDVRCRINVC